jgi:Tfp pilus assembly protein PilO
MDKTKQTLVIALVAVLAVVAGGWQFLVSPQRSSVAALNAQTSSVDSANASLTTKIAQLKSEAAQLPQEQAALAAIAKRLPPDIQAANLLDDLSHAADAANVDLQVITPGAPVLAPSSAVAPPAPVVSGAANTGTTAATAPKAPANQLYQVPLSLTVTGNYFDLEMFIHTLEGMQRAMLINGLTFTKSPLTGTSAAGAGVNGSTGATTAPKSASGTQTTSGTSTSKSTSRSRAGQTTKPVPGSAGAAQAELNRLTQVVPDADTLSVAISGQVFVMYSPAAAAAAAVATPATPAPTK